MVESPISGLVWLKKSDRRGRVHMYITPEDGVPLLIANVKESELEPEIKNGGWVEVGDTLFVEGRLAYQAKDHD